MTLSTLNKGWAVAQVAVLIFAIGGGAFPMTANADQSNFGGGHDQHFNNDSQNGDQGNNGGGQNFNNGGNDGNNGGDNGGQRGNNNGGNGGDQGGNNGGHSGDQGGQGNNDNGGDHGNGGGDNGGGQNTPPPPTTATVVATKIVCDNESDLPNKGATGAPTVDATTATDYVAAHPNCHLSSGWSFQWAPDGTDNPGDNTGAAGSPWTTFGPTGADGTASTVVPATNTGVATWVREVWQNGYIPFTFNTNNQSNADDASAEMYCNTDGLNYDNYDAIDGAQAGSTYYCVAFNALAATTTDTGGDNVSTTTDSGTATTTDSGSGTTSDTTSSGSSGGGGGGSSFGGGNWGNGCAAGFIWNASALKCVPQGQTTGQGQVLGASCGIYLNKNIMFGSSKNDPGQVTKLQTFLNTWMSANLPLTGVYDSATFSAVKAFQNKYQNQVLKPWGENTPATGLVYLSTIWQINNMECPSLTLDYPTLIPWNLNPNAQ